MPRTSVREVIAQATVRAVSTEQSPSAGNDARRTPWRKHMDITVVARNAEIHPNFRAYVEEKVSKITQFYPRAQRVDVELTHERNPRQADTAERIELTVYGKGPIIRAEAQSADRYAAVDIAAGKLYERLRRLRDRTTAAGTHATWPKLKSSTLHRSSKKWLMSNPRLPSRCVALRTSRSARPARSSGAIPRLSCARRCTRLRR